MVARDGGAVGRRYEAYGIFDDRLHIFVVVGGVAFVTRLEAKGLSVSALVEDGRADKRRNTVWYIAVLHVSPPDEYICLIKNLLRNSAVIHPKVSGTDGDIICREEVGDGTVYSVRVNFAYLFFCFLW